MQDFVHQQYDPYVTEPYSVPDPSTCKSLEEPLIETYRNPILINKAPTLPRTPNPKAKNQNPDPMR